MNNTGLAFLPEDKKLALHTGCPQTRGSLPQSPLFLIASYLTHFMFMNVCCLAPWEFADKLQCDAVSAVGTG